MMLNVREWFIALCLSCVAVLAPLKQMLLAVFVLVCADFVFGVLAAIKSKTSLTSNGFRRSIVKLLVYEIVISSGYICEQFLTGDSIPISKIIAGMIGVSELTSLLENATVLSDKPVLKSIQMMLIGKLKSSLANKKGPDMDLNVSGVVTLTEENKEVENDGPEGS